MTFGPDLLDQVITHLDQVKPSCERNRVAVASGVVVEINVGSLEDPALMLFTPLDLGTPGDQKLAYDDINTDDGDKIVGPISVEDGTLTYNMGQGHLFFRSSVPGTICFTNANF